MHQITLKNLTTFNCQDSESILDAALAAEKILEHSCRTGRCGVCKTKVISGTTEQIQSETALTVEELKQNIILTCCRKAITDVELDCEDLGEFANFFPKMVPCRIEALNKLTDSIMQVILRTPSHLSFGYIPGQYIDVIGQNGLRRSYSISNAPNSENYVELHIREVEQGEMSQYWFHHARKNDLLRFHGPHGTFALRENDSTHMIFLATGTGIAPIKAILEQLSQDTDRISSKTIHLYWGARTREDIYWHPPSIPFEFHFHPVLSRPALNWEGKTGYIQQSVIDDQLDLTRATVYACGSEQMIDDARTLLRAEGLDSKNFFSDAFVSSNQVT